MELRQYITVGKENQMYDIRIFIGVLMVIAAFAGGVAAVCSIKCDYRPNIRPAYGDTSWCHIDELEEL